MTSSLSPKPLPLSVALRELCVYTQARKDYIHIILFLELISPKITFQLQEGIFLEFIPEKLHYAYSFVIQRITWKNVLEIIFLENLVSVTWNNVFGVNFSNFSGWSVCLPQSKDWGWPAGRRRHPKNHSRPSLLLPWTRAQNHEFTNPLSQGQCSPGNKKAHKL